MGEQSEIVKERFETLLRWLDPDRDTAGQIYLDIRLRMVKMFLARGCPCADDLADETMERVTKRCLDIVEDYEGDPIPYFYGVAHRVFLEDTRKPRHQELPAVLVAPVEETDHRKRETKFECLKECLAKLPPIQRKLIVNYYDYSGSKRSKIDRRKEINQDLGITPESMRIRIFRIRTVLASCIRTCVEKNYETF